MTLSTRSTTIIALATLATVALPSLAQTGRLIAVDNNRSLYEIDMATAARTQIGTVTGAGTTNTAALAFDCATQTLYLSNSGTDSLYTLDVATAQATLIGAYGDPAVVMHGLEWDGTTLFGYSSHNSGSLYSINTSTGAATLIGVSGLASFGNMAYDSANDIMYITNSSTDSLYTIDRTTAALTLIGPITPGTPINPHGIAYNWHNDTIYLMDTTGHDLYTLDRATGAGTLIGDVGTSNLLGLAYISTDCGGGSTCPADLDNGSGTGTPDGGVTIDDLLYFLVQFEAGSAAVDLDNGTNTGTPDGGVTIDDLLFFLLRFEAGC